MAAYVGKILKYFFSSPSSQVKLHLTNLDSTAFYIPLSSLPSPRGKGRACVLCTGALGVGNGECSVFLLIDFVIPWGLQHLSKYSFNHVALQCCPKTREPQLKQLPKARCRTTKTSQGRVLCQYWDSREISSTISVGFNQL